GEGRVCPGPGGSSRRLLLCPQMSSSSGLGRAGSKTCCDNCRLWTLTCRTCATSQRSPEELNFTRLPGGCRSPGLRLADFTSGRGTITAPSGRQGGSRCRRG